MIQFLTHRFDRRVKREKMFLAQMKFKNERSMAPKARRQREIQNTKKNQKAKTYFLVYPPFFLFFWKYSNNRKQTIRGNIKDQ